MTPASRLRRSFAPAHDDRLGAAPYETDVSARLDRLPWGPFHWLVVLALGASWIIDGLEVTLAGAVSGVLQDADTLALSSARVGATASFYLAGAVAGALVCGHYTDRYGRARMFFATLAVYLAGTLLSAFAWDFWSLSAFRFITGIGIGGEYAAINSAIDELVPARVRGRVNLAINGSFWVGALLGAAGSTVFLDTRLFPADLGWRLSFGIGAALGVLVFAARRHVPESPRWLAIHGQPERAEAVMRDIEARAARRGDALPPVSERLLIHPRSHTTLAEVFRTMSGPYRTRSALCFVLITSQAFLYNAIFFTYALVLRTFYGVDASDTGFYLMPFAVANFLGPLVLGHAFDTLGRRTMIAATYTVAGVLLLATGYAFMQGWLSAATQTALWACIFFFASAAASSAYLTASEVFPVELRAIAIAVFFALGTAAGGVVAPALFGALIGTGSRAALFTGYATGAAVMLIAAAAAMKWGVRAERAALEAVAPPLSSRSPPPPAS